MLARRYARAFPRFYVPASTSRDARGIQPSRTARDVPGDTRGAPGTRARVPAHPVLISRTAPARPRVPPAAPAATSFIAEVIFSSDPFPPLASRRKPPTPSESAADWKGWKAPVALDANRAPVPPHDAHVAPGRASHGGGRASFPTGGKRAAGLTQAKGSPKRARVNAPGHGVSVPRRDPHPLVGSASELFGGFDVAPSGMGAYDAYPGFKDGFAVGHVLPPAAHAHAGTPDGAVGKSLADVFTTPGDFAGGFAPSLLPLGGNGNPFALPLMDGGKLPGPGPDAAGIAPHAMLNLGEPPVFTPGGGVKGVTAEDRVVDAGGPERRRATG